ncbi:heme NO-binding domain-containing protein [Nibribacter koreensis]|uniref:Heme NO-binding domain-containing protein n=1 Tax=Nibribacter koreensis TaxID=1084519 RepID=A0ABP8F629_9BACT
MDTERIGNQDMMHGSIFVLLKRFVEYTHDHSTWLGLVESAGVENASYQMHDMYPTDDLFAIVARASELSGTPVYDLMEQYGEFIVPDLLMVYKKYISPEWHTYDMLLNTEEAMHGAVRREDPRTTPPMLLVTKSGRDRLIVDYYSKRRMAGVAVGIIRGIANYYGEGDQVTVNRMSDPEDERVQIFVDFKRREGSSK